LAEGCDPGRLSSISISFPVQQEHQGRLKTR
jgi:hypothetical protein